MFKNFDKTSVSANSQVKNSVGLKIKKKLVIQFPLLINVVDVLFENKKPMYIIKCKNQIQLLLDDEKKIIFFNQRDGIYMPSLRVACKYPTCFPCIGVDKGAIRHVLSGSDIMDRGITSKGGNIPAELENLVAGDCVVVLAENKTNPIAIGILLKTLSEIKSQNSGKGIQNIHYLGDLLWDFTGRNNF